MDTTDQLGRLTGSSVALDDLRTLPYFRPISSPKSPSGKPVRPDTGLQPGRTNGVGSPTATRAEDVMQRALMALAATLAMSACGEDGSGLRCTNHSHLTFDFITGMRGVIVVR